MCLRSSVLPLLLLTSYFFFQFTSTLTFIFWVNLYSRWDGFRNRELTTRSHLWVDNNVLQENNTSLWAYTIFIQYIYSKRNMFKRGWIVAWKIVGNDIGWGLRTIFIFADILSVKDDSLKMKVHKFTLYFDVELFVVKTYRKVSNFKSCMRNLESNTEVIYWWKTRIYTVQALNCVLCCQNELCLIVGEN